MARYATSPLNGVLAMAQIMALGELPQQQRERVEVIRRSGEDLLAVLNDVLDISKIEAGRMQLEIGEVDAAALAASVRSTFAPLIDTKKNLRFVFEVQPEAEGMRRGDPVRIGQILNNLVSNAIKFTAEGEVNVTIGGLGAGGRDGVVLVVRDSGVGIAADKLPLLFQKSRPVRRTGRTHAAMAAPAWDWPSAASWPS